MATANITATLTRLAHRLDELELPYLVVGGQAVLLHGEPRFTRDIDITLAVGTGRLPAILALVRSLGWRTLPSDPEAFVDRTMVLPCADDAGGLRLDLIFGVTAFERQAVARARIVNLGGTPVRVAAAEDLIVFKLFAGRPRDREDVAGILRKQPRLDLEHIRRWLRIFDRDLERELGREFERLLAAIPPR